MYFVIVSFVIYSPSLPVTKGFLPFLISAQKTNGSNDRLLWKILYRVPFFWVCLGSWVCRGTQLLRLDCQVSSSPPIWSVVSHDLPFFKMFLFLRLYPSSESLVSQFMISCVCILLWWTPVHFLVYFYNLFCHRSPVCRSLYYGLSCRPPILEY